MFWSKFKWLLLVFLVLDLVFVNYRIIKSLFPSRSPSLPPTPSVDCPSSCVAKIDQAILAIPTQETTIETPVPSRTPNNSVPVQTKKTKSVTYLPIPGNGSSLGNTWGNLSGTEFNFNTEDYPNLKEAYFEANMKLINGNGLAYLRLFDITAGIEVWGSEIKSSSQEFTVVVSGKLTLRPGNHLYRVQAKSLTADTAVFNSGRIKLVSEN